MKNLFFVLFVFCVLISETFAYSIKVYDEYGNRVGTFKKEGENYQLYDFYDKKVDRPDSLIQNVPTQKTLTEYSRTFYDENMMPIGTWYSGYYGNDGRYYPRDGEFIPFGWRKSRTPYIVRPQANSSYKKYADFQDNINYIDTRFPRFHKFK